MVEPKEQAPNQTPQQSATTRTDLVGAQQSPSPIGEAPGLSNIDGQMQHQQGLSQVSHFDVVREDDRRRYALGEHPGPDWNDDEAMKAWLEQRFPQGTAAGSPYYQFMILSSRFEDTYWLPGRGSKMVLSKFSESEWKKWKKEKAGLVLYAPWGEKPLYPDEKKVNVQEAPKQSKKPSPKLPSSIGPLQANQIRKLLDKGLLARKQASLNEGSSGAKQTDSPIMGASDDSALEFGDQAAEKFLNRFPMPSPRVESMTEEASSSKKRTAEDADLDMSESPIAVKIKQSPGMSIESMSEEASSSKKRTAEDAEINMIELPVAKKIKQSSGTSTSFEKTTTSPSSPRPCASEASSEVQQGPPQSISPPQDRDTGKFALYSQPSLARGEAHAEKESEPTSLSDPQALETLEEAKADEGSIMPDARSAVEKRDPGFGGASDEGHSAVEDLAGVPRKYNPANQPQQIIQVVIPASPPQPSEKRKERLQQHKKRRVTSETAGLQTPYTTEHLRSGIRNRRHTLPNLVHLETKGRREVQVPGCFRY